MIKARHCGGALWRLENCAAYFHRETNYELSLDPDVADLAPNDPALTGYDEEHLITYLRMLDANADGADWRAVSLIVLHIDAEQEPDRARRAFVSRGWNA